MDNRKFEDPRLYRSRFETCVISAGATIGFVLVPEADAILDGSMTRAHATSRVEPASPVPNPNMGMNMEFGAGLLIGTTLAVGVVGLGRILIPRF